MHSFLVISKDPKKLEEYANNLCKEKGIDPIDQTILVQEGSIGIAQIRMLQNQLYLKPLKSPTKACIIKNAEKLTIEAQNALLKILEEPPDNTIVVLTTDNKEVFLQTVLSRCKIIALPSNHSTFNIQHSIFNIGGIGERLKLAETLAKNKEETIGFLENMILSLRQEFISGKQVSNTIRSLHKTYVILKTTNANPRLTLENLFLSL